MNTIHRIITSHTLNKVAGSIISVYIAAYLLTLGYSLSQVLLFYIIVHCSGLFFALILFPHLYKTLGLLHVFKLYYPLQIIFLLLLSFAGTNSVPIEIIAVFLGFATFAYWMPLNILFNRYPRPFALAQ